MTRQTNEVRQAGIIANQFLAPTTITSVKRIGSGHIHSTFRIASETGHALILQRLNQSVFPDLTNLIANHLHLQSRWAGEESPAIPRLVPSNAGEYLVRDADGHVWRAMTCLEGRCLDIPASPDEVHAAAQAFGIFARRVNLPEPLLLQPSLADFHNTPLRLHHLKQAAEHDPRRRRAECEAELATLLAYAHLATPPQGVFAMERLPLRVIHADTKINNLLYDPEDRTRVSGIVDLDTVMPGWLAFDFGDLVRTAAVDTAEDEIDLSRIHLRPDYYDAILEGYREGCGDLLRPEESLSLGDGALVITYEVALRFLTDHLLGDIYFHTARPNHNLIRARTQIALLEALLEYRHQ
ncbi:MAG: aminoglycoside phosphotransferase family protein [Kiritimatiellae bacterium]|nr:aminoglycoside phosphotransferase family protein [Kiritimatiellia bacterium]